MMKSDNPRPQALMAIEALALSRVDGIGSAVEVALLLAIARVAWTWRGAA
jgi:hypothetical protein